MDATEFTKACTPIRLPVSCRAMHTVVPNKGIEVVVVVIEARVKVTEVQGEKKTSNCPPASLSDCPSTFWIVRRGIFLLSPEVTCQPRSCQFEIPEMGLPAWPEPPIKSPKASHQQESRTCWLKLITCFARVFIFSFIPGEKSAVNQKFPEQWAGLFV